MADTDNLLSPEELEALTAGIEDGSIETDTGLNISALAIKHDITNEDRSLSMNLTAINLINERFVREFRVGLLDVLRTTAKVNTAKAEIMAIQDYMKTLEAPLALSSLICIHCVDCRWYALSQILYLPAWTTFLAVSAAARSIFSLIVPLHPLNPALST